MSLSLTRACVLCINWRWVLPPDRAYQPGHERSYEYHMLIYRPMYLSAEGKLLENSYSSLQANIYTCIVEVKVGPWGFRRKGGLCIFPRAKIFIPLIEGQIIFLGTQGQYSIFSLSFNLT